ncbi:MAG: hypothetical protein ACHQDF_02040 [Chitinophagales bacterium]
MHKTLIGLLLLVLFVACDTITNNEDKEPAEGMDTLRSFVIIKKDSAHVINYRFKNKTDRNGGFSFIYANEADSFSLFLDTSKGTSSGRFGGGGMLNLDLEKAKYYDINGRSFKVFKLIEDKNVTDGSFSIFLTPDFGLLVSKPSTWRMAKVICPDKNNSNYVYQLALLYRIQTDEDFFENLIPNIDKKMKIPKVE